VNGRGKGLPLASEVSECTLSPQGRRARTRSDTGAEMPGENAATIPHIRFSENEWLIL